MTWTINHLAYLRFVVGRAKLLATFEGMAKTSSSRPKGLDIQLALARDKRKGN